MSLLRSNITIELLNQQGSDYLPGYLGIVILKLEPNTLSSRMPIQKLHVAPNDFLHAASVVALADTSCGYATIAHLPEGAEGFTTIELKTNFLGTLTKGVLLCAASAVHSGRTTQVWDAEVSSEDGRRLALFRCTQMMLWPKVAAPPARI